MAQYENGGVYIGEFSGDVRCGWGTHYFPGSKDKYEGEWAADRMTGEWMDGWVGWVGCLGEVGWQQRLSCTAVVLCAMRCRGGRCH